MNELILIECPCRHWCHMKFFMHQSSQFTLPLPMWQEMRKGILCSIRFVHFTSILSHEMCRGSQSHCRPKLCLSLAGELVLPGWLQLFAGRQALPARILAYLGTNTCLRRPNRYPGHWPMGFQTARHIVLVPGMEAVGTV